MKHGNETTLSRLWKGSGRFGIQLITGKRLEYMSQDKFKIEPDKHQGGEGWILNKQKW
jgi:hypothetical protein